MAHAARTTGVTTKWVPLSELVRINTARHLPKIPRDFGRAGRSPLCAATAGEDPHTFARHFGLHSSATTVSVLSPGGSHAQTNVRPLHHFLRVPLRFDSSESAVVAEALQFSTAANFATAFRRWTAVTPSEYRRRNS